MAEQEVVVIDGSTYYEFNQTLEETERGKTKEFLFFWRIRNFNHCRHNQIYTVNSLFYLTGSDGNRFKWRLQLREVEGQLQVNLSCVECKILGREEVVLQQEVFVQNEPGKELFNVGVDWEKEQPDNAYHMHWMNVTFTNFLFKKDVFDPAYKVLWNNESLFVGCKIRTLLKKVPREQYFDEHFYLD